MAKTRSFANFATGEKKTGAVLLPTHFTTASQANKEVKQSENLVWTYAAKNSKVIDENNQSLVDVTDAEMALTANDSFGYSSRFLATGDEHSLFDGQILNMTDDQMDHLDKQLNTAQKMDGMMTETHGQQHQGQLKWSEKQDNRLRKELANGIYRQFNENFKDKPNDQQGKSIADQPFQKDKHGNFEKIRHANVIDNESKDNQKKDGNKKRTMHKKQSPLGER